MSQSDPTHWQILRVLKASEGVFSSGTQLASQLGLTRTGIWKHIQNLRTLGYEIESHPKEGYRLSSVPDLLLPEEILPNLKTSWLGKSYHYFERIGSTNDQALSLANQGAPHGTVVIAEEQTEGRGRLKRPWLSASRCGIYMSMLLRTPLPVHEASQSNLVAALAYVRTLREEHGLEAAIKWPNDVLIGHKKAAGILTEMQSDQDFTRFLVIGIGMNVNYGEKEMAGPFRYPATSLALELGFQLKRQELLLAFLHQFETQYDRFLREGFAALIPELERASGILGRNITVRTMKGEVSGRALGLTAEGALKILSKDGKEDVIWVGDVTQVEGAL